MPSETFLPTPWEGYINVDGKILLHRMWVSQEGVIAWRRVPIIQGTPGKPIRREVYPETVVFNDQEWGDDGTIRPMSQVLPGD